MSLTFQDYQKEKLGEFKHKISAIRKNTIILSLIGAVTLFIFYISTTQKFYDEIIVPICALIITIISFLFGYYVLSLKPTFQEYIIYYIYMGESSLETYLSLKDRPKKYLKKSRGYFRQLFKLLDRKILDVNFEKEKIRNQTMRDIRLLSIKYILPRLTEKINQKNAINIRKITHNILPDIYDENFEKLHNFLKPYIEKYYPKKITIERIKTKFKSSPILSYGLICTLSIIGIVIATWTIFLLGGDWEKVMAFFTLAGFAILIIKAIIAIIQKPEKK